MPPFRVDEHVVCLECHGRYYRKGPDVHYCRSDQYRATYDGVTVHVGSYTEAYEALQVHRKYLKEKEAKVKQAQP